MRVKESVEITRPPQEVWDFVADPMNDVRWCRKVKTVTPAGQGRWIVKHKPVPLRPAVDLTMEQLELDPPSRLVMREEDGTSVFNVEYRLEAIPTGTRFTQVSEFDWKRLPRLLIRTFERGVRRDIRGQLRDLKGVLEASRPRS